MNNKNTLIGFFGIGIFTYLSISNITYLFGDILKDIFINVNLEPSWSFWLSELLSLVVFVLLINYIINWVFGNSESISKKLLKYFVWSFLAYFIIQFLIIVYPLTKEHFGIENNNQEVLNYLKYLKENYILYFIQSILYYLGEILAIILIYSKIKNGSQHGYNSLLRCN